MNHFIIPISNAFEKKRKLVGDESARKESYQQECLQSGLHKLKSVQYPLVIHVFKADRVRIMEDRVHYRILIFSKYKSLAKSNYISVFIALFIAYDQDIESLRLPAFFLDH